MQNALKNFKRTNYCGEFTIADVGKEATVFGWVAKHRDLGALVFIDLRDRSGIVQLAFDESTEKQVFEAAAGVRNEFVLAVSGTVQERSAKNADIPTGDVEIKVEKLAVLGESETPPFEISDSTSGGEQIRLKYRYLDLRRPQLQSNIILRHRLAKSTRDYFDENGFIEIETPILIKSTPEGARDYLVPSRLHHGEFYALPQSPQIYKQLCMVAGFDKYFQIARCFRDEDLRADRQPEFTQLDLEMSFVDIDDVLKLGEGYIQKVFNDVLGVSVKAPFKRYTYDEVMERYGSDKPDTRYGLELFDLSAAVAECAFGVFSSALAGGGTVRGINAKNSAAVFTRKEIDKLTEYVRGIGAKGLAWVKVTDDGITSSFSKFMTDSEMAAIAELSGAQSGDVIFIVADSNKKNVLTTLGSLRTEVAKKLDIIKGGFDFLWVTEFPFFEYDDESGQYLAMHHPFTSPTDECLDRLEEDKSKVYAKAYDLVLNGVELASGSIRITDPALQKRMFQLLGLSDEEAYEKFGFLTDAFRYGAPPHGGMGLGLDRLAMQMLGAPTLRDVIAFPKIQNASEPMTECPARVDPLQLDELGLSLKIEP